MNVYVCVSLFNSILETKKHFQPVVRLKGTIYKPHSGWTVGKGRGESSKCGKIEIPKIKINIYKMRIVHKEAKDETITFFGEKIIMKSMEFKRR